MFRVLSARLVMIQCVFFTRAAKLVRIKLFV